MQDARQLDQSLWEQAMREPIALIGFQAPWCAPCRLQKPILEAVCQKFRGRVFVGRLNIENHRGRAKRLGIRNIPTLILFKQGQEVGRFVGLQSEKTLSRALETLTDEVERSV